MNKEIFRKEVQQYIEDHLNDDINKILLGKSPFPEVDTKELAQQIDGKKRCEKKLPLWFSTVGIYFPPKLNIEQTSSELTAKYKSMLVRGKILADLTGGFGVDSYYFSQISEQVIYIEQNKELAQIAEHNSAKLESDNIRFVVGNSIEFLQSTDRLFDTIYIDPARRIASKKVFLLKDTEPDVVENLDLLLKKASRIIIKTSPLLDIQSGLKELKNVSEVHVVSVKNDCKELLWVIDRAFEEEPDIVSALIGAQGLRTFRFKISEEKAAGISLSAPLSYIYEPDVALLKAGAFKSLAERFKLFKLHTNTHIYTSQTLQGAFPGKTFQVKSCSAYKDFVKTSTTKKANIIARNFPLSPEELKKKHKVQDGGEIFLIFCTTQKEQLIVIEAERLDRLGLKD